MKTAKPNKKGWAAWAAALLVILAAAFLLWASTDPPALESVKELTVTVEHTNGTTATIPVRTTARYLYEALEPLELLTFADSDYGTILTTVDGEFTDIGNYITWTYAVNGADPEPPMNELRIADGDTVKFYTITW